MEHLFMMMKMRMMKRKREKDNRREREREATQTDTYLHAYSPVDVDDVKFASLFYNPACGRGEARRSCVGERSLASQPTRNDSKI